MLARSYLVGAQVPVCVVAIRYLVLITTMFRFRLHRTLEPALLPVYNQLSLSLPRLFTLQFIALLANCPISKDELPLVCPAPYISEKLLNTARTVRMVLPSRQEWI